MQIQDRLVLEISRRDQELSMSLFAQEGSSPTVRHYSQRMVSAAEIDKLCVEVSRALNRSQKPSNASLGGGDFFKNTGQLLWDHLLTRQVKESLRAFSGKGLVLSLDEELIHIPWELLYTGEDFLCLKFRMGRLIKSRQQYGQTNYRAFSGSKKMLVLANPTDDLKSAYSEGLLIKNKFDRKRKDISIDFKSTYIDKLYVKKNLNDYDIVHFAGHCEFDKNNLKKSGWVLSDGIFNSHDITALGEGRTLPSLVFSNACLSADSHNLAPAFLFSGVRHYLGTIWRISDPVGLDFAQSFYTHLINGRAIGECVRLARMKLIRDYGAGGLTWASYLLYGDPDLVMFRHPGKVKPHILKLSKLVVSRKKLFLKGLLSALTSIFLIAMLLRMPLFRPGSYIQYAKSREFLAKGMNLQAADAGNDIISHDPLFLQIYPVIAEANLRLGKSDQALKFYLAYVINSEKKKDYQNLAAAYNEVGWFYHKQGDYQKALDFYNKAIDLSQRHHDLLNQAVALRKLAVWHIDKKEDGMALELLTKSSEINRENQNSIKHQYNLACDYFDIGLVFINKDDLVAAKEFYNKSYKIFSKLKVKEDLSDYYFNMGEIHVFNKEYLLALESYRSGLKIDLDQGNLPNLPGDYGMFGELYRDMGEAKEAEAYFLKSESIAKEINSPVELAGAYYNLSGLYRQKNQKNKAREYLRLAQDIYRTVDPALYLQIKQEFQKLNE